MAPQVTAMSAQASEAPPEKQEATDTKAIEADAPVIWRRIAMGAAGLAALAAVLIFIVPLYTSAPK